MECKNTTRCPCDDCRIKRNARKRAEKARRKAIDPELIPHGLTGYRTYSCRCDVCREGVRQENTRYRNANADKVSAYMLKYNQDNNTRLTEQKRKYYYENIEYFRTSSAAWRKANPEKEKAYSHRKRSAKVRAMSKRDMLKSEMHRKRIKNNPCYYCGQYSDKMHDDHYYPLIKGGTDHWWNLVRACATCNCSKNAKLASEWEPNTNS